MQLLNSEISYKSATQRLPEAYSHVGLIKKLLHIFMLHIVLDEKRGLSMKVPSGGVEETLIEPLTNLLTFISKIQVA